MFDVSSFRKNSVSFWTKSLKQLKFQEEASKMHRFQQLHPLLSRERDAIHRGVKRGNTKIKLWLILERIQHIFIGFIELYWEIWKAALTTKCTSSDSNSLCYILVSTSVMSLRSDTWSCTKALIVWTSNKNIFFN